MKKKIMCIFICTLFVISAISSFSYGRKIVEMQEKNMIENNIFHLQNSDEKSGIFEFTCDTGGPYFGLVGELILFEGEAFGGYEPYEWLWDFGDGYNCIEQNPEHVYDEPGVYEVSLQVTDAEIQHCCDFTTATITEGEEDNEPPEVTITYPEDGDVIPPEIVSLTLTGYVTDNVGVTFLGGEHVWDGGSETSSYTPPEPCTYCNFDWQNITLYEGWNEFTIYAYDAAENYGYHTITVEYYSETVEGLHIDSKFQPEQVVYQHDILYPPDDLTGGPCEYNAALGMVTGKNTYLFGHPYSNRFEIKMTCCNNYDHQVEFQWVLKIFPDNREIWRSETVTVPAKTTKTFTYAAPLVCPGTPFQWNRWNDDNETKPGSIELSIDPDLTGGSSPCNCKKVIVKVVLHKTHDLEVLFVPFTFGDGPPLPPDLANIAQATAFDTWRWNTLEPWWNAIYPVRENGLNTYRNWLGNLQKNLSVDGIWVNNLSTYQDLTPNQRFGIRQQFYNLAAALGWMGLYDRVVFLVDPGIIINAAGNRANGMAIQSLPTGGFKQGVLVNWNVRSKTAAHEVSHTYGLGESYTPPGTPYKAIGYWVNRNEDVVENDNTRDLMWRTFPIWDAAQKSWIKKPNYRILLNRFTNEEDPKVLGISGFIDNNDNIKLNQWYKLDNGNIDLEWGTSGNYLIKAYDNNGFILDETGFNVSFMVFYEELEPERVNDTIFAFRVEWIDGINRIDIVNATSYETLASRTISSNPPKISIITPSISENIKQGMYEITWYSNDVDGDTLTSTVFISNNSDSNWYVIDFDNLGNSFTADFTNLPKGDYKIKIIASDGVNTGEDTTGPFSLPKVKFTNTPFLTFLENHPHLFPLLRQILGI